MNLKLKRAYFHWMWLPALLVVLWLIQWSAKSTATISAVTTSPPLLAFYYGWYDDQTWTSGLSPDMPLQPYRSADPAVVARHVRQAREAGIEGFVMSWYGPQVDYNQTEPNFRMLLDEAQRQGFKAAVDFETRGPFFPDRASVVAALRYLLDTHARHPAYFRLNGKPLVFFWKQDRFSVDEWKNIRQEVDPDYTSLWIAEGTNLSYQFQFDGHHLYNISWADDVNETLNRWRNLVRWFGWFYDLERYWVATTMPGFDERHLNRPDKNYRPRGAGEFYKESWQAAMATEPDILIITSFNEWIEHSQIEPSVTYDNYYLDLTRALRFEQPYPPTPVLPTPTPTLTPSPTPTPGRGSIIGLITDAMTGERLIGVTVSVDGQTTLSDAEGYYRFENVTDGLQVVVAGFPGYLTAQKPRIVADGGLVWNSIAMMPGIDPTVTPTPTKTPTPTYTPTPSPTATPLPPTPTPAPGTGALTGLITNIETGKPVAGAVVSGNGQMVMTNNRGIYTLAGLPPGEQLVSSQHPQFAPTAKAGIVVSDVVRWNSFSMVPLPTPTATATPTNTATATNTPLPTPTPTTTNTPPPTNTATSTATATPDPGALTGLVTNIQTGERLTGVLVSAAGQTVQSNSNGLYLFTKLPPGQHLVLAEHPDFHPVEKTGIVVSNQTRWNSMSLSPRDPTGPTETPTMTTTPLPTASPTATLSPTPTPFPAPTATTTLPPTATPTATPTPSPTTTQTPTMPPSPTATATSHPSASPTATLTPAPAPSQTPTPVPQTGVLIGLITDIETGQRLAGVTVSVVDQTIVTNERGVYRFEDVPSGLQVVTAEKDGYQPGQKAQLVVPNEARWNSIKLTANTP